MSEKLNVVKVILKHKGMILAAKEKESGKWELPGGLIEDDGVFEAAKREMLEETGLEVSDLEEVLRIRLEEEQTVDCSMVYAKNFSGDPNPGGDITELKWVKPEEFKQLDWHRDAGFNIPVLEHMNHYLK
jgi:8-oxo-dGTP pyrophosphatase MutT (NUDIX family)